jgi:hypothetical protein
MLHQAKGKADQAKKCIFKAVQLFEECEAEVYLGKAKEALATLGWNSRLTQGYKRGELVLLKKLPTNPYSTNPFASIKESIL